MPADCSLDQLVSPHGSTGEEGEVRGGGSGTVLWPAAAVIDTYTASILCLNRPTAATVMFAPRSIQCMRAVRVISCRRRWVEPKLVYVVA